MVTPPKELRSFEALVQVVKALRDPQSGCPWDLEQTHQTLTQHMTEEAFEAVEALESGNRDHMVEELGDVLLQVVLNSEIARQEGRFDILDVIQSLNEKLVFRHSHVFSDVKASDAASALANWDRMKAEEKAKKPQADHFEVPVALPSLQRSQKIGAKTKKFNFDWPDIEGVLDKVEEELGEVKEALASQDKGSITHEMGDLLFSVAQLARHAQVDAEAALRQCNRRFETRFFAMKLKAESQGKRLESLSVSELETLWQDIKRELKNA